MQSVNPQIQLVNGLPSTDELKLFYPTSHLRGFGHLSEVLGLFGQEYTLVGKACWYCLMGHVLREVVSFGRVKTDLRFPVAFVLPSGHGKLNITSLIEETGQKIGDHVSKPTSYHPEQLIGKVIRKDLKKETKFFQVKGHFDSDVVIFDDGIDLIQSKDPVYKESRRYLCGCLDVIGSNLMMKKPVDVPKDQALKYYPKCSVILFFQPFQLPEESFLSGVFRRFIIIYLNFDERDYTNEYEQRLGEAVLEDHLQKLVSYLDVVRCGKDDPLSFSDSFKKSFQKHHLLLEHFGRTFGAKASNFTRIIGFTLQNWLLKMSVILARSEGRTEVTEWDIERGFLDLLEILDSTFRFVEKKVQGDLDYGESWGGAMGKDREMLELLALADGTSEEKSRITIEAYIEKIQEIMGLSESGACKRYRRHKKKEWIKSRQYQHTSRVWLAFNSPEKPEYDFQGDQGVPVSLAYYEILENIEVEKKNRREDRDTGTPWSPSTPPSNDEKVFEVTI
jgi:hypothetical protein